MGVVRASRACRKEVRSSPLFFDGPCDQVRTIRVDQSHAKIAALLVIVLMLTGSQTGCLAINWPAWFDRAPLNTDAELVGIFGDA
jgi:hypothetical protein